MRRFVRMFQPRFAPMVEDGTKRQTVRRVPKRVPEPGDLISLREWTGKPYRSKQRVLKEAVVERVERITITSDGIVRRSPGSHLFVISNEMKLDQFAREDGFGCWRSMKRWFVDQHGLPFEGIVIYWKEEA